MIPKKIIYSGRATIVFWQDGTKTVVKREKGAKDDKYQAVCSALAIKTYGTNSHFKKLIKEAEKAKKIPKEPKEVCAIDLPRITNKNRRMLETPERPFEISASVDTIGTIHWEPLLDLL